MVVIADAEDNLRLPALPGAAPQQGGTSAPQDHRLQPTPPPDPPSQKKRPKSGMQVRMDVVEVEIANLHQVFDATVARHIQSAERRRMRVERQRIREQELQARADSRQKQEEKAISIQSVFRRLWVQQKVVPALLANKRAQELEARREKLALSLVQMREVVHDLKYVEEDRERATVCLQSWWRGFLARRAIRVLQVWRQLSDAHHRISDAAMKIQNLWRSRAAKTLLHRLRSKREELEEQAKREQDEDVRRKVVKIQAGIRRYLAQRLADTRRQVRAKAAVEEAARAADADGGEQTVRRRHRSKTRTKTRESAMASRSNLAVLEPHGRDEADAGGKANRKVSQLAGESPVPSKELGLPPVPSTRKQRLPRG